VPNHAARFKPDPPPTHASSLFRPFGLVRAEVGAFRAQYCPNFLRQNDRLSFTSTQRPFLICCTWVTVLAR
jgi:hypothetical protein